MRVELMFPGRYLTAADLLQAGRDVTREIVKLTQEEMRTNDGKSKLGWCIHLQGVEKLWVLNKTNALVLSDLYGPETNEWIGKRVTLYAARVQAFGKTVDAIRVRPQVPEARQERGAA